MRAPPRLRARLLGEGELHELHARHRVEDVEGDEPVGPAAGTGELGHRQRGRRRGQEGGRREPIAQPREHVALGLEVLRDRLDDEGRLPSPLDRSVATVTRRAGRSSSSFAHSLAHRALGALGRCVAARPQRHRPVAAGDDGQAAGDRPAADDPEPLGARVRVEQRHDVTAAIVQAVDRTAPGGAARTHMSHRMHSSTLDSTMATPSAAAA